MTPLCVVWGISLVAALIVWLWFGNTDGRWIYLKKARSSDYLYRTRVPDGELSKVRWINEAHLYAMYRQKTSYFDTESGCYKQTVSYDEWLKSKVAHNKRFIRQQKRKAIRTMDSLWK